MPDPALAVPVRTTGPDTPATAGAAQRSLARAFADALLPQPQLDARVLTGHACGLTHEQMIADPGRALDPAQAALLRDYAARRLAREPVSRITGTREFWGLEFALGPDTLDPRPDSETLVAAALEVIGDSHLRDAPLRIADLGTGSGCLLVALLSELPNATGCGVDICEGALAVARANAQRNGAGPRATFVRGSWDAPLDGPFDLVVANPPYIPRGDIAGLAPEVAAHDPVRALDGGADGLDAFRAIASGVTRILSPRGWLAVETGAGQGASVRRLMEANPVFDSGSVRTWKDLSGTERCVAVRARPAAA